MGGRGNAATIITLLDQIIAGDPWKSYFDDFLFPYTFPGPDEYENWLHLTGIKPVRIELIPKQMIHSGESGLAGWIRTTWLPYLDPLPPMLQEAFIDEFVHRYVNLIPADKAGKIRVEMVRLEIEAKN